MKYRKRHTLDNYDNEQYLVIAFSPCRFWLFCGITVFLFVILLGLVISLMSSRSMPPTFGERLPRKGQEIMVCGQLYNIDHDVVLWTDVGGYDAYRVEQRFQPFNESSWNISSTSGKFPDLRFPNRYDMRCSPDSVRIDPGFRNLTQAQIDQVRGGGWDLNLLTEIVDQFVIHYDAEGLSKTCFEVLHDKRDLSVHFMLDVDGTIYQTLDVKEKAWHATIANTRSIGIEIANIGAYPINGPNPFTKWYRSVNGRTEIILPQNSGVRTPNWIGGPIRPEPIIGVIQGEQLRQYDLTTEQYVGLSKLVASLVSIFPKLKLQFPTDENGQVINRMLNSTQFAEFQGILGHYHVQSNKVDPGPAFQWEKLRRDIQLILDM